MWGGAGGAGLAAGSFLGGLLTQFFGWRAVFFVNVPLVVLALVVSVAALPAARRAGRIANLDLPGALCVTVSVSASVSGVSSKVPSNP